MYYIIVPSELCEHRRVFTRNPRTPDGRVVLTLRDLQHTGFSYGDVQLVNEEELQSIISASPSVEPSTEEEDSHE